MTRPRQRGFFIGAARLRFAVQGAYHAAKTLPLPLKPCSNETMQAGKRLVAA